MAGATEGLYLPPPLPPPRSSVESNFRELDDAFLQTQTRIWLGEVLQIRFDEQMNVCDLLADGELLFEVSEVVSRMLPALSVDSTQPKVNEWKSLASNKSTRRYMPYYNVDSFLRMCKNLGMDGIDLFIPSDVVEKRDTRKVCMCIRSLSKKARLRDLNVPDFDSVTCTLSMPTDMVECIRKSLEMSQCSSSLSQEQETKVSRVRFWRRMSNSVSALSSGYSDNCDEVESSYLVAESYGSSDCDYGEPPNIPGSQVVTDFSALQLNSRDLENDDDDQCEYLSPSNIESVGSPCSQYYSDKELIMPSPNCLGSRVSSKILNGEAKHGYENCDVNHVPIDWGDSLLEVGNCRDGNENNGKIDNFSHDNEDTDTTCCDNFLLTRDDTCDLHLENLTRPSKSNRQKSLQLGGLCDCVLEDDFHTDEAPMLSLEDTQVDNNAVKYELVSCELSPDDGKSYSHGKVKDKDLSNELIVPRASFVSRPAENMDSSSYTDEDHASIYTEVTHIRGNTCCGSLNNDNATSEDVAGEVQFAVEKSCYTADSAAHNCNSTELNGSDDHQVPPRCVPQNRESLQLLFDRDTIISADIHPLLTKVDKEAFDADMGISDHTEGCCDSGGAATLFDMPNLDLNSSVYVVEVKDGMKSSEKDRRDSQEGSEDHKAVADSIKCKPTSIDDAVLGNSFTPTLSDPQPGAESFESLEDTGQNHHQCAKDMEQGESEYLKQEGPNKEMPLHKPERRFLKSVIKGTALLGVAVFLLHLRKNSRENISAAKRQPIEVLKRSSPKPPSQKDQKGGSTGHAYPAEKLHLRV